MPVIVYHIKVFQGGVRCSNDSHHCKYVILVTNRESNPVDIVNVRSKADMI